MPRCTAANDRQFGLFDQAAYNAACEPAERATPQLADAVLMGEAGMARAARGAGENFAERAEAYVLEYLGRVPHSSTELLTDACKRAGIKPRKDDRAFGPVYAKLIRAGTLLVIGECKRRKGHGTRGGNVVALASKWPKDAEEAIAA